MLGESVRKICIQQSHFVLAKVFLQPDSGKKEGDLNFFLGLVNEETEGCKGDVLKVEDLIEACWCSLLTELAGELGSEKGRKNVIYVIFIFNLYFFIIGSSSVPRNSGFV